MNVTDWPTYAEYDEATATSEVRALDGVGMIRRMVKRTNMIGVVVKTRGRSLMVVFVLDS